LLAAGIADSVTAGVKPLERLVDLCQLVLELLEQRLVLLVLEHLRADVRGMLVVAGHLGDAGRVRDGRRVAPQTFEYPLQAGAPPLPPGVGLASLSQIGDAGRSGTPRRCRPRPRWSPGRPADLRVSAAGGRAPLPAGCGPASLS